MKMSVCTCVDVCVCIFFLVYLKDNYLSSTNNNVWVIIAYDSKMTDNHVSRDGREYLGIFYNKVFALHVKQSSITSRWT